MATKRGGAGKNPQIKTSEVVDKKRKTSQEAGRSPLRVAAPAPAAVDSPAPEVLDAGEAVLPEKTSNLKKVLRFRNHFPEGILKCRPGCDYSDDDDD